MHKKVVVTGVGALAPNGNSAEQFWSAIESGTSGIAPITYFDASNHRVSIAGELKDFNPEDTLDPKEIRKLDPFSTFALVCSNEAVQSANLDLKSIDLDRAGVVIGSGIGGIQTLESEHDIIKNKFLSQIPTGKIGYPKDIANTVIFLASDEAEYITGQTITVDGGRIIN